MKAKVEDISFYFFDFDDNIMFLETPIFVRNTKTGEIRPISTTDFPGVHPFLGKPGDWENFEVFDGSFGEFDDIPIEELEAGQKQHFVRDVERALETDAENWQAPSWDLFVHACRGQRPVSIVTARGHSPETLQAGIRVLADRGLIPCEPNYLSVYPVGNRTVRREQLGDADCTMSTPDLKREAIKKSVDRAMELFGAKPAHRFGMSDDDPSNVNLVIRAMCECKKKYPDKRFFAISTHMGEKVKLEVFPVDFPVTSAGASESTEPLDD